MSDVEPPVTKYRLTVVILGNTHQEIERELLKMVNGGYLLASGYNKHDTFDSTGSRDHMVLEHTNPEMTPERYASDLETWWLASKAERKSAALPVGAPCLWDQPEEQK